MNKEVIVQLVLAIEQLNVNLMSHQGIDGVFKVEKMLDKVINLLLEEQSDEN